jgi:uncharacterized protein
MRGPAQEPPPAASPLSQLQARIERDLTASRKAQDKPRTLLLGTILSDLKNRRIELRQDLTDDDVIEILRRGIKRRRESVEMYEKGNREDLAAREREEVQELEKYLPAQVSDEELRAAVREAVAQGAANIGAVMGRVMPRFKGRADGSTINAIAREELARGS